MRSVEVQVPASAANLGPGFDCLALALSLVNRFTFSLTDDGLNVSYEGIKAGQFPLDDTNLAVKAFYQLTEACGVPRPGLQLQAMIEVPPGSGLGSSSTAVVAGLLAANRLMGLDLTKSELLTQAASLEGHADNAAAALYGGLVIVRRIESQWQVQSLPLAQQQLVVVVPELDIATDQMRAVLPGSVPRDQAVSNAANLMFMAQALASADFDLLRSTSQVSFHQQARLAHIPGAEAALRAGQAAGGAVMLAGAGPGLIAMAPDNQQAIGLAMQGAFKEAGIAAQIYFPESRQQGGFIRIQE